MYEPRKAKENSEGQKTKGMAAHQKAKAPFTIVIHCKNIFVMETQWAFGDLVNIP